MNKELKQKVFALYWGQEIAVQNEGGGYGFKYTITADTIQDIGKDYLLVTPLSDITDEDVKALGYRSKRGFYRSCSVIGYCLDEVDYLRSKGYALSAYGKSVEELIELGIFKLKKK